MKYKKTVIEIIIALTLIAVGIYFLTKKDIFITLNGNSDVTININGDYKDEGVNVLYCGKYINFGCVNIADKIKVTDNINNKEMGSYTVTYQIKYKGINKEIKKTVKVKDIEPPIITLAINENSYTCPNKEYIEEGYTVTDNIDNDLHDKVTVIKEDKGWTYTVSDSAGNKASIFRKHKYNDTESPSLSLNGYEYEYIKLNSEYKEPGYLATDNCEGDITSKVKISGNVDTTTEGLYKITYKISDLKGNTTTRVRNVRVYEKKHNTVVKPDGKVIYLTFDDGPCKYTKRLLDILDYYDVKVTFFVTNQFDGYTSYIKEAYDRGHSIALHTSSHSFSKVYSSIDGYFKDLEEIDNTVFSQIGIHPNLVRFPGGSSNTVSCGKKGLMPGIAKELETRGYKYFDWNVNSDDTSTTNKETIKNNIINGIKQNNYSVVLQHDLKPASIEAVVGVIEYGLLNGYTFLPLTIESPTVQHKISNCHY